MLPCVGLKLLKEQIEVLHVNWAISVNTCRLSQGCQSAKLLLCCNKHLRYWSLNLINVILSCRAKPSTAALTNMASNYPFTRAYLLFFFRRNVMYLALILAFKKSTITIDVFSASSTKLYTQATCLGNCWRKKKCKPQLLLNQDQAPVFVSTYSNQEHRTCSFFLTSW